MPAQLRALRRLLSLLTLPFCYGHWLQRWSRWPQPTSQSVPSHWLPWIDQGRAWGPSWANQSPSPAFSIWRLETRFSLPKATDSYGSSFRDQSYREKQMKEVRGEGICLESECTGQLHPHSICSLSLKPSPECSRKIWRSWNGVFHSVTPSSVLAVPTRVSPSPPHSFSFREAEL